MVHTTVSSTRGRGTVIYVITWRRGAMYRVFTLVEGSFPSMAGMSNVHAKVSDKKPLCWFVYLEEDIPCKLQYVGSTISMTGRWANIKSRCNKRDSDLTGLYKHFRDGCPQHTGEGLEHIRVSLIDYMDTDLGKLREAGHRGGNCKCAECDRLRRVEVDTEIRHSLWWEWSECQECI